jgi:hypothetical protein
MRRRKAFMDSPWIKFTTPDANREYFALLSYLPLNKYRAIPAFMRFSLQIQKQLQRTTGIIGYSLRAKLFSRNFWTLSAWADEKSLMEFVVKIPHGQAMKEMAAHMGPTKFTKWKVPGSVLPLQWKDAMLRSQEGAAS